MVNARRRCLVDKICWFVVVGCDVMFCDELHGFFFDGFYSVSIVIVLLSKSMLSSAITMTSFFSDMACCHLSRTLSHLSFCCVMPWLSLMFNICGSVHCLYMDATNMGLFLGSFSSIHTVDVVSSSRSVRRLYIMSSFIIIMFLDWFVLIDIFVCSIL